MGSDRRSPRPGRPDGVGVQIRQAGADTDWPDIHALLTRAFAYMEGRIDPPSSLTRMSVACLAQKAARETVLLAEDPRLVGCLFATSRTGALYLGKIAIDPDCQGRGIGRALLAAATEIAKQKRLRALELQTRVELVENHAAFSALGFETIAKTRHSGFDRATSLTMRRPV
ncbi:MAG: GNAT family N-acetyltransferase [Pseudomonadota bacterium]